MRLTERRSRCRPARSARPSGRSTSLRYTSFARTRETAELAWPGAPALAVPELNEITFGELGRDTVGDGYGRGSASPRPEDDVRAAARAGSPQRGATSAASGRCSGGLRSGSHSSPTQLQVRYLLLARGREAAHRRARACPTRGAARARCVELERAIALLEELGGGARFLGHTEAMLDRVEAFIREHDLIEPGGEVRCSSPAAPTRHSSGTRSGELGYRVSALHVAHGLRGRRVGRGRALLSRRVRSRCRRCVWARLRGRAARARYAFATDRPAGDRAYGLRPGRVGPARARRLRLAAADQAEAGRRRRAAAARRSGARKPGPGATNDGSRTARTRPTRRRSAA